MIQDISSIDRYPYTVQQNGSGKVNSLSAIGDFSPGSELQKSGQSSEDVVQISDEARQLFRSSQNEGATDEENAMALSEEEQALVDRLQSIDRKVRAHEQAHVAAGGNLITKGASFEYETGPDGKRYAVGGEVSIDVSKEQDPEDTMRKAARVRAAAMAPADPSPQDRRVAAEAASMAREASMEMLQENTQEMQAAQDSKPVVAMDSVPREGAIKNATGNGSSTASDKVQGPEEKSNEAAAEQVGRNRMNSAAMAYQSAFHLTEPAMNRVFFA